MFSREELNRIREEYPPGTRLELLEPLDDKFSKLQAGDKGTVHGVDDAGHILMSWSTGGSLSLIIGIDKFRKCE